MNNGALSIRGPSLGVSARHRAPKQLVYTAYCSANLSATTTPVLVPGMSLRPVAGLYLMDGVFDMVATSTVVVCAVYINGVIGSTAVPGSDLGGQALYQGARGTVAQQWLIRVRDNWLVEIWGSSVANSGTRTIIIGHTRFRMLRIA